MARTVLPVHAYGRCLPYGNTLAVNPRQTMEVMSVGWIPWADRIRFYAHVYKSLTVNSSELESLHTPGP